MCAAWATSEAVVDEWLAAAASLDRRLRVNAWGVIMDKREAEGNLEDALRHIQKALGELNKFQPPSEDDYDFQYDDDDE